MAEKVLWQDWVTMRGEGYGGSGSQVSFYAHRDKWIWTGDARGAVLLVDIRYPLSTEPGLDLEIESCVAEDTEQWGWLATYSTSGTYHVYLTRVAGASAVGGPLGTYLRWRLTEPSSEWRFCFRLGLMLEPA